jgi:hypothetical protein
MNETRPGVDRALFIPPSGHDPAGPRRLVDWHDAGRGHGI